MSGVECRAQQLARLVASIAPPKHGSEVRESARSFQPGVTLLERLELALVDERLHEQTAVENTVDRWRGELGRGKCRACIYFGAAQIAASEREPAAARQAEGKPAAVAARPRLGDEGVEQRPH